MKTLSGSRMRVAGTQALKPLLLLFRVCTGGEAESGIGAGPRHSIVRSWVLHLQGKHLFLHILFLIFIITVIILIFLYDQLYILFSALFQVPDTVLGLQEKTDKCFLTDQFKKNRLSRTSVKRKFWCVCS